MQVAIIGGGSVGLLMASFLAEYHVPVTMITRRNEQAEKLLNNGLRRLNIDGTETTVSVHATIDYSIISKQSLVIIAVKYNQLQEVLLSLRDCGNLPPLLFLQNGLSHYEQVLQLSFQHVAFGSVSFGAQKENDFTVIHRGIGVVQLAQARGDGYVLEQLVTAVNNPRFSMQWVADAEQMLFQKAFFNCLINPLTFLLQVKNGALLTEPHAFSILKKVYDEMVQVFPEVQCILFEQVEALCEKTAMNTSSMLSDRLAGRQTEIETIVGAVLKKAENRGEDLPTLRTLYHLILHFEGYEK